MGHEGKILIKREDKRVDQSSHNAELATTDSHLVYMDLSIMEILEQLKEEKIYGVGIVGLSGAGKTTLAKEVGKKARESNLFDLVVFISVSRRSNEKKIQDQIAKGLGLRWVTEDLRARAEQIFMRLRGKERILIILDDIWKMFDLQQIGIPSSKSHMGCKLILTSRHASLIQNMECQFLLHQYLLSDEAAWSLFCKWADYGSLDPRKVAVSGKFSKKCRGLPLAALLAGGGLRGKTIVEWEAATDILWQDSEGDFGTSILSLSIWSYKEGLSSKVARSLFLISGLFPENEIPIEHLSNYAITLGLCGENEVNEAFNSLIYRGLLMHYEESKDHVIMHDLIREAAQWIVEKENPAHRDNIIRYLVSLSDWGSLSNSKGFQWEEELDALLHQMFHVRESSSTSSIIAFSPHHFAVIAQSYTHLEPSGKLVDFKGLCLVDESYLPLLKEACRRYPQLIKSQAKHSKTLKQTAFNSLGQMLFMLSNASVSDWVYLKDELKIYWDQALLMEFDMEWLKPAVDKVLSSTEIHRIEALRKEEEKRNTEATKLRQELNDVEAKAAKLRERINCVEPEAAYFRTEIALIESKVNAITEGTRRWNWKIK